MNEDFLERMVTLANNVGKELGALPDDTARYDMVEQIMDSAEIVFAVWKEICRGWRRLYAGKGQPDCMAGRCR